jgi:hypothetical protein
MAEQEVQYTLTLKDLLSGQLKNAENISAIMAGSIFGDAAGKVISVLLFLSCM